MRLILALALALIAPLAAAYDCLPTTVATPLATGTATVDVTTPAGTASAWWCLVPITAADVEVSKVEYAPQFFVVLNKYRSATQFAAAAARIGAASDPVAQARIEVAAATMVPAPGSQDAYDFAVLRRNACIALATKPYLVATLDDLPADYCGAAPVPPVTQPPPTTVWRTPATGRYTLYNTAGGKLTGVAPGAATPNAQCDGTAPQVLSGTSVYLPLLGGSPTVVTLCKAFTQ